MIPELRKQFNAEFTPARYAAYINDINHSMRYPMDFRLCETPLFIDPELHAALMRATDEICTQLRAPDALARAKLAIPPGCEVPNETYPPEFVQVDFALVADARGKLMPRLIELQGFPSLYGFQWLLDIKTRQHFKLHPKLTAFYSGHDAESFAEAMREVICAGHVPEHVALLEVEPEKQKTRIDFACMEHMLGIPTVDLNAVIRRGRKLFYRRDGRELPIERIYNRVIFDDLQRRTLSGGFQMTDDVDVEWAGHPNWFFKISKYSLPLLHSEYVPPCMFLSEVQAYPADLNEYVLKPLYSFSGMGVELDPTPQMLDTIPEAQRQNYILQRKIDYAPVIETPDADERYARAEVRILLIWRKGKSAPEPVCNLVRMSKGRMMGTRYNKDRTWVGSGIGFTWME